MKRFHSHAYFDHTSPEGVAEASAFRALTQRTFAETGPAVVGPIVPGPAGPHPCGSFEVLFPREMFADYVVWLMLARPEGIDILVHPLTGSHVLDHTSRALWLGKPRTIDLRFLSRRTGSRRD
jgi:DOPA 4,5-dioxygenase